LVPALSRDRQKHRTEEDPQSEREGGQGRGVDSDNSNLWFFLDLAAGKQ